jgi:hypothetical protein
MKSTFKDIMDLKKITTIVNKFKHFSKDNNPFIKFFLDPSNDEDKTTINAIVGLLCASISLVLYIDNYNFLSLFIISFISSFFIFQLALSYNQKKQASKINLNFGKHICINKMLDKKNVKEINQVLSELNKEERELLVNMLSKNNKNEPLKQSTEYLSYTMLLNKLNDTDLEDIREHKDIIFDFIKNKISTQAYVDNLLKVLTKKLEEETSSEKIMKVEEKFNDPKTTSKITHVNKSLVIKSI